MMLFFQVISFNLDLYYTYNYLVTESQLLVIW